MVKMNVISAPQVANCQSFQDLMHVVAQADLFGHLFAGALLAEIGADGRIREAGRFGIAGEGPSAESVPLWDSGLIATALKRKTPSLIADALTAAQNKKLTPNSDIDGLVTLNGFESVVVLPLRHNGLLFGVVGLCSVEPITDLHKTEFDFEQFQSLMRLATRSIAYGNEQTPTQQQSAPQLTSRDRAVLSLLAGGHTNKEIARELSLSLPTVKVAVSNLLSKFSTKSRHMAVDKAKASGLI